ncbi:hypothetical protein AX16_010792 [Volvariella volvacea WC 439]|nr:hypothetical protein AX16_010792 [Volvariella volvacea WC 439]
MAPIEHPQSRSFPIESCPNEILIRIQEHLEGILVMPEQQLTLRLVNRRFNAIFTRLIIRKRHFSWCIQQRTQPEYPVWQVYDPTRTRPRKPTPEVFIPFIHSISISIRIALDLPTHPNGSPQPAVDQLDPFWRELQRHSSLRSLFVQWEDKSVASPHVLYRCISDKLMETVHQLTGGRLSLLNWQVPISLQLNQPLCQLLPTFHDLQRLELRAASLLGNLLLRHPCLCSISLTCEVAYPTCKLEELFPVEFDELALDTIKVQGTPSHARCKLYLHASTHSQHNLRNLRNVFINSTGLPKENTDLDSLWATLKQSGTRLKNLSLHYGISDALMEYLSTYGGLTQGEFYIDIPPTRGFPSHISFTGALLRHATSLTSLVIIAAALLDQNKPRWESMAFNPLTWPTPSLFSRLRYLSIITQPAWKFNTSNLQHLLNYATEIAQLNELQINWPCPHWNVTSFTRLIQQIAGEVYVKRCKLEAIRVDVGNDGRASWEIVFPPPSREEAGRGDFLLDDFELILDDYSLWL